MSNETFDESEEPTFTGLPEGSREQYAEIKRLRDEALRMQQETPEALFGDTESFTIEYSQYFPHISPNEVTSAITALSSGESKHAIEIAQKLEDYLHGDPRKLPAEFIAALGGNTLTFNEVLAKLTSIAEQSTVLTYRLGSTLKV